MALIHVRVDEVDDHREQDADEQKGLGHGMLAMTWPGIGVATSWAAAALSAGVTTRGSTGMTGAPPTTRKGGTSGRLWRWSRYSG
jgi:hypothetical protein